jgi:uncharacterized protein (TIGR02145 family)
MKALKQITFLLLAAGFGAFFLLNWSCKKDDPVVPAEISTLAITEITTTSAKSGGNIISDGGGSITARGLVWHTSTGPTLEQHTGISNEGSGIGLFSSDITGISPNTHYFVRAFATNSAGIVYGNELQFNSQGTASISTAGISNITPTSATGGGNIISDGNPPVSSRGVVWNITPAPTVESYLGMTNEGIGIGSFTSEMIDLIPGTTYYARAYATSQLGTVYGDNVSFSAVGSVTDIDGNEYEIILIGNQVWMAENLKTGTYNNGTVIPKVTDDTDWFNLATGAHAWYGNSEVNFNTYGALYNWYAVETGNLCPAGWHVPGDDEWTVLADFLGGKEIAGGKLKAISDLWKNPNEGATDETGFTALPGGGREEWGTYFNMVYSGNWWAADEYSSGSNYAFFRAVSYFDTSLGRNASGYHKKSGFSVRCLMND